MPCRYKKFLLGMLLSGVLPLWCVESDVWLTKPLPDLDDFRSVVCSDLRQDPFFSHLATVVPAGCDDRDDDIFATSDLFHSEECGGVSQAPFLALDTPLPFKEELGSESEEDTEGHSSVDEVREDGPPSQKKSPKKLTASERRDALLQTLKRAVCFKDLKNNIYHRVGKHIFHLDILQAMCQGYDIYEDAPGYYCCRGVVSGEAPVPCESVAVAMFNLLRKPKSLFELRFQLYGQGYRGYSPEFLMILEKALIIGEVHPYKKKLQVKGDASVHETLVTIWNDVQGLSRQALGRHLQYHVQQKAHHPILRRLWELNNRKHLQTLRDLKASLPKNAPSSDGAMIIQSKRRIPYLNALQRHPNEVLPIDHLWKVAKVEKGFSRKRTSPLRVLLLLALEGWPIIYNKDSFSVIFFEETIPAVQPQKETNLLTMIYDLAKTYQKKGLTQEEIAYYALRGGYLQPGLWAEDLKDFYKTVLFYTKFLVVHGHVESKAFVLSCQDQDVLTRESLLWLVVLEKDERPIARYKELFGDITQKDLDSILAIKEFGKTKEYEVFYNHLCAIDAGIPKEKFVQMRLQQHPLQRTSLWILCEKFGIRSVEEMWTIAKNLTQRVEGGRLIYNPKTTLFSWDRTGFYGALAETAHVSEIFLLQQECPDVTNQEFFHMLAQRGVEGMSLDRLKRVFFCLKLLGLCDAQEEDTHVLGRKRLRSILAQRDDGCAENSQACAMAQEVFSWLGSGAMAHLWRTYLQKKDDRRWQEAGDAKQQEPVCKRQRLETPLMCAEDIIERDIPELKDFLCKKNLWNKTLVVQ